MSLAEFYICNGINPYDPSFDDFFEFGGREWEAERLQDFSDEDSFDDKDCFDDDDENEDEVRSRSTLRLSFAGRNPKF